MTDRAVAYTLFCEDIRPEPGGKFSAIGVYPAELGIPQDTQRFAKFVIVTVLSISPSQIGEKLEVSLWDREELLVSSPFEVPGDRGESGIERIVMQIPIEACPFDAKAGMSIRVKIKGRFVDYESAPLGIRRSSEVDTGSVFGPMPTSGAALSAP